MMAALMMYRTQKNRPSMDAQITKITSGRYCRLHVSNNLGLEPRASVMQQQRRAERLAGAVADSRGSILIA